MEKLSTKRIAKTTGLTFAAIHAAAVLAMQGGIMQYWEWAHMVSTGIKTQPFNAVTLVIGIVFAGIVGAVIGSVFAGIYNKVR